MAGGICAVYGCNNYHVKNSSKSFFSFPRDITRWTVFLKRRRVLVTIFTFITLTCKYILRGSFSVAVVAMTTNYSVHTENDTENHEADLSWDLQTQNTILSSFYYTVAVAQFPGAWIADRFGGNVVLTYSLGISGILYMFVPLAAQSNANSVLAVRILQGAFEACTLPAVNILISFWAPQSERNRITTTTIAGSYFGYLLGFLLSGAIAERIGWKYIFYIFGGASILWSIVFSVVVKSRPDKDPSITQEELTYIQESLKENQQQHASKLSSKNCSLFASIPVWVVIISGGLHVGLTTVFLILFPEILHNIFGYSIEASGFVSAAPTLFMIIFIFCSGQLADFLERKGVLTKIMIRKIYIGGTFLCQTILLIISANLMPETEALVCMLISASIDAISWNGLSVNLIEIDVANVATTAVMTSFLGTCIGIAGPILIGYNVDSKNMKNWKNAFYIISGLYLLGASLYIIFGSTERQFKIEKRDVEDEN